MKGLALLHIHRENEVSPKDRALNIFYAMDSFEILVKLTGPFSDKFI